jgi:hypothetical protein
MAAEVKLADLPKCFRCQRIIASGEPAYDTRMGIACHHCCQVALALGESLCEVEREKAAQATENLITASWDNQQEPEVRAGRNVMQTPLANSRPIPAYQQQTAHDVPLTPAQAKILKDAPESLEARYLRGVLGPGSLVWYKGRMMRVDGMTDEGSLILEYVWGRDKAGQVSQAKQDATDDPVSPSEAAAMAQAELPHPILCPKCDQLIARTDGKRIAPESIDSVERYAHGNLTGYGLKCGCGHVKEWSATK